MAMIKRNGKPSIGLRAMKYGRPYCRRHYRYGLRLPFLFLVVATTVVRLYFGLDYGLSTHMAISGKEGVQQIRGSNSNSTTVITGETKDARKISDGHPPLTLTKIDEKEDVQQNMGGYSNLIRAGDSLCNLANFNEYYKGFFDSKMVPFESTCLKAMIREDRSNLHLRIAHVRRRYLERVSSHPLSINDDKNNIRNQTQHVHSRHLIFYCRGDKDMCGGIGDRLRGMTRAFYYALAFNSTFSIVIENPDATTSHLYSWDTYFDQPYDLEMAGKQSLFHSLVLDGLVKDSDDANATDGDDDDFRLPHQFVRRLPRSRTRKLWEFNDFRTNIVDYERVLFPDIKSETPTTQYAVFQTNQLLLWGPNGGRKTPANPYCNHNMFHDYAIEDLSNAHLVHIFLQLYASKPSAALYREIRKSTEKMQNKFIVGMHLRMGNTGSGEGNVPFNDATRHSVDSIPCLAQQANQICEASTEDSDMDCALFVVSDSNGAVEKVRDVVTTGKGVDVITPGGNPFHVDKPETDVEKVMAGNMKMFADWYILGDRSDALIISRSGFSLSAAVLKNNGTSIHQRPLYEVQEEGPDKCVRFAKHEIPEYGKGDWGMDRLIGECSLNPWNLTSPQTFEIPWTPLSNMRAKEIIAIPEYNTDQTQQ